MNPLNFIGSSSPAPTVEVTFEAGNGEKDRDHAHASLPHFRQWAKMTTWDAETVWMIASPHFFITHLQDKTFGDMARNQVVTLNVHYPSASAAERYAELGATTSDGMMIEGVEQTNVVTARPFTRECWTNADPEKQALLAKFNTARENFLRDNDLQPPKTEIILDPYSPTAYCHFHLLETGPALVGLMSWFLQYSDFLECYLNDQEQKNGGPGRPIRWLGDDKKEHPVHPFEETKVKEVTFASPLVFQHFEYESSTGSSGGCHSAQGFYEWNSETGVLAITLDSAFTRAYSIANNQPPMDTMQPRADHPRPDNVQPATVAASLPAEGIVSPPA